MSEQPVKIIIEPGRTEKNYWQDIWRYRELFYILSWRDIKVKYKQATLGILWAFIRPFLTMLIFTYVFQRVANLRVEGIAPYAIMVFAGLLPWQFFASAVSESAGSLADNEKLITKVYFPRLIVPASSVITSFIDFLISFGILLLLFAWYQYVPTYRFFFLPFFIALTFLTAFGIGLLLTALNVKYRDFRYIIPFIIQFGLFITPVGFATPRLAPEWQWVLALNPMVGIVDGFRWCIVVGAPNPLIAYPFYISLSIILFFIVLSFKVFRKMEKHFADLI